MTDQTIEAEIQAKGLTAPRVTPEEIDALEERVLFTYAVIGTSTFCHAFLDGTFFLVSGHSACVSPENFDAELGRRIAFENVQKPMRDKLWELKGYVLWELEGYALRSKLADTQTLDQAVTRFLAWQLPTDFGPDGFIGFDATKAKENNSWPTGTNLLTAQQARQMLEHVLG